MDGLRLLSAQRGRGGWTYRAGDDAFRAQAAGLKRSRARCRDSVMTSAMYRDEKEAQAALASSDPIALCRLGWHEHESVVGRRIFFKYMSGRTGVRLNFWIGAEPAEWTRRRLLAWARTLRRGAAPFAVATCPNLSIGPPTGRNRVGD